MIRTKNADGWPPDGVRVYEHRVYLFVGTDKTYLVRAPDLTRGYDVKPLTILAKQDFNVSFEAGELTSLTANQDTTAFLTFASRMGDLAAKAAGVGVSAAVIDVDLGLPQGIYLLRETGEFERIQGPTP